MYNSSYEYKGAHISNVVDDKTFLPIILIKYQNYTISILNTSNNINFKIIDREISDLKNKIRLNKINKLLKKKIKY